MTTSLPELSLRLGRYRLVLLTAYLLMAALIVLSVLQSRDRIEINTEIIAREQSHVLLQQFVRVWHWSQQADAAAQTSPTQSTLQAIFDTDIPGISSIRYRLIDLDHPLQHTTSSPQDAPDTWEIAALQKLQQQSLHEYLERIDHHGEPVYRYMARLAQDASRTASPSSQILSITLPASTLNTLQDAQLRRMLMMHGVVFVLLSLLIHAAIRRTYRHVDRMKRFSVDQQALLAERTADLSASHARLAESESRYRSVVESTHDGIALIANNHISFANARLAEMLGYSLEDLVDLCWTDLLPVEQRAAAMEYQTHKIQGIDVSHCLRTQMRHRNPAIQQIAVDIQVRLIREADPHGETDPMEKTTPNETADHDTAQWILNVRDVTGRLLDERERRIAEAVFESVAEAIMVTDAHNRITAVNPAFTNITGYTPEEALGQSSKLLSSGRHDANFYTDMWRILHQTGAWSGEIWNRRKDGSLYVEWLTIRTLHSCCNPDSSCDMEGGHVATFTDITQRKEAEDRLRYKAHHDTLTNLPNRSLFEDHLQLALSQARRYRRDFALLYIDLDYFKKVNDTLGHAAGDVLLVEVAQRMALCIRESDTLSRFGGDEFAALLTEISDIEEVEEIAQRIVSTLDSPFELSQGLAKISGSVGIAIYPQHGTTADTLKHHADLALYSVKRSTRNNYRIYTPEMDEASDTATAVTPTPPSTAP